MSQNSEKKSSKEIGQNDQDDIVSQPSLGVNSHYHPLRSLNFRNQSERDLIVQQENQSISHQTQHHFHEASTNLSALQPSITSFSDALLSANTPLVGRNVLRSTEAQQSYLQHHQEFIERFQYMSRAANLQYQPQISTSRHQLIDSLQSRVNVSGDRIPNHATAYGSDRLPVLANQWNYSARQAVPSLSVLPTNSDDQGPMPESAADSNFTRMTPNDAIPNSKFAKKREIDGTTLYNEKSTDNEHFKSWWEENEQTYNILYQSNANKDLASPRREANSSDTVDTTVFNHGRKQTVEWSNDISSQKTPSGNRHKKQKIEIPSESGENLSDGEKVGSEIRRFGYNPGELVSLSVETDEDYLSEFQCFLRKQICYFEASELDLQCSAQGRNTPISLDQVGLVCRHCAVLPPRLRQAASAYFPTKFDRVYQASQNLCAHHLMIRCGQIPESIRSRLHELKGKKTTTRGGGKKYWVNGAKKKGIVQTEKSLRFSRQQPVDK